MLLVLCFGFLKPTFLIQASLPLRGEREISNMNDFTLDSLDQRNNFEVPTGIPSHSSGLFTGQVTPRGSGGVGSGDPTRPARFQSVTTRPDLTREIFNTS